MESVKLGFPANIHITFRTMPQWCYSVQSHKCLHSSTLYFYFPLPLPTPAGQLPTVRGNAGSLLRDALTERLFI
jgi:hypothetical protein